MEREGAEPSTTMRQARPSDATAIRDLTRAAYAKWVPVIGREPKPMTADYEAAVRQHRFDLLFVEDLLAGLVETVDESDCLLIENVAILPSHQGRGLGRMLLEKAEEVARAQGRARLRLYTNKRFVENITLYEGIGYVVDREEDLGFAVVVHMRKLLARAHATSHVKFEDGEIASAEPMLFVRDMDRALEFYVEKLGFRLAVSYGEPTFYAQIVRGGARLNLRVVHGPIYAEHLREREPDILSATLTLGRAEPLFSELKSAGVDFHQTLRTAPWGASTFIVRDPDGNLLCFAGHEQGK